MFVPSTRPTAPDVTASTEVPLKSADASMVAAVNFATVASVSRSRLSQLRVMMKHCPSPWCDEGPAAEAAARGSGEAGRYPSGELASGALPCG